MVLVYQYLFVVVVVYQWVLVFFLLCRLVIRPFYVLSFVGATVDIAVSQSGSPLWSEYMKNINSTQKDRVKCKNSQLKRDVTFFYVVYRSALDKFCSV